MLLKRKIPIAIISLVSIPLIFLSIIIYSYTSSALMEINKNRIRSISKVESEQLTSIISSQKKQLQLMAKLGEFTDLLEAYEKGRPIDKDTELGRKVYWNLRNTLFDSAGIENIFIAGKDGKIIMSANDDIMGVMIKEKPYFKMAIEGQTPVSNILPSDLNGYNLIVVTTPIKNSKNQIVGIMGNSIKLDYFKDKIAAVKMKNQGYAYIVDAKGIVVAHPDESKVGMPIENKAINDIVATINRDEVPRDKEGYYIYKGQNKFMAYSIIEDLNWLIVFAQDISEMNRPARIVFALIIATTLSFILLAIYTSIKFSKSITKPINELTETMSRAAAGDLNSVCKYHSKDEFGQLSTNFNSMLEKLNQSYEELTAVYEELAATQEELRSQYEELRVNEDYLRKSEEKYKLALEGANDAIWEWEYASKAFHISDKWDDIVGIPPVSDFSLQSFLRLVHKEDIREVIKNLKDHITSKTEFYKSECRIKLRDDRYKWILVRGKASRNRDGEITKVAGSVTDISDRKMIEEKIVTLAYYDTLTKLPNRVLFMEKLSEELKCAKRDDFSGMVMFVDLDNFKNINDTLGHDYGDELLGQIANKFREIVKGKNTVCRFGGDEFLILSPKMKNSKQAEKLASLLLQAFEAPFFIKDKYIYTTASIGISIYPKDGESVSTLLKNADTAMYAAKALGKNRYSFFDYDMCYGLERKTKIEALLREALIYQHFELYYQPQVNVANYRIEGFEALLRLKSEEFGPITPQEFIPIAEECGLINDIGEWCLKNACLQNKKWRDEGYHPGYIAVNLSTIQLQQANFKEIILNVLSEVGLKPEYLEIEITETVLMQSLEKNIETLEKLKALGIKIALDDFGTGYSSFNYLRRLPINTLKIDKSFIDGICRSKQEQAIAHGIIQLAHQMSLKVVAEGVENHEQLAVLRAKECDRVQGYLFSKPVPAQEAEKLMAKKQ